MQSSDSKQKLSLLRKTYLALHKTISQSPIFEDKTTNFKPEILWTLVFLEAARRLRNLKIDASGLFSLTQKFLLNCSYLSPLSLNTEQMNRFFQGGECKKLEQTLASEATVLDKFDERYVGYFYQLSQEAARYLALSRIQSSDKKSTKQDIIHFTQLYTPDWVADFLLQETLLAQWSGFSTALAIPLFHHDHSASDKQVSASQLRMLDPACGAGHILLRAFDLLMQMHLSEGHSGPEACKIILSENISGCDLDETALQLSAFALLLKALPFGLDFDGLKLKLFNVSLELDESKPDSKVDSFERGSLERQWAPSHCLSLQYHAVVTNPPYIGRRLLDRRMKEFLRSNYANAYHDLSAAFLVRALELTKSSGRVGFITQSSLLYLPSYESLRKQFIDEDAVATVVELGTRVFPLSSGEKINSMLIVLRKKPEEELDHNIKHSGAGERADDHGSTKSRFLDLSTDEDKLKALLNTKYVLRNCKDFLQNRSYAFHYKYPDFFSRIIDHKSKLADKAEIKQGLATSDNARFVRFFWDVEEDEIGRRWHPYVKGAGAQRWFAPCHTVLDWGQDGAKIKEAVQINYPYLNGRIAWVVKNESYYFRRGLTFSFVSTGNFAVRRMEAGCIFDVGGSALFCEPQNENYLLAYLNSSFASLCADVLNPTLNFQVGDIKEIPFPELDARLIEELAALASQAYELKKEMYRFDDSAPGFLAPSFIEDLLSDRKGFDDLFENIDQEHKRTQAKLETTERTIDELILHAIKEKYSLSGEEQYAFSALVDEHAASRVAAVQPIQSRQDFAQFLIRTVLDKAMGDSAILTTDQTEPVKHLFHGKLKISLEEALQLPLSDYLLRRFNSCQDKIFFRSPKIVSAYDASKGKLIFLSNRGLRLLEKANTVPPRNSTPDNTAPEILASISNSLKGTPDWTGKDLCRLVQEKFLRVPALKFEEI